MSIAELPPQVNGTVPQIPTPAPRQRELIVVEDNGPLACILDTAKFDQMYRVAKVMAAASLIPDHLRFVGTGQNKRELPEKQVEANCFLIVNQATLWGMHPFSVAPESYVVGGKLAFQGKLIAGVINARAGLEERLRYEYDGAGDDRTCTAIGTFKGEKKVRVATVKLRDVRTDNQMFRKDPDQKLSYNAAIKWARLHCPEIILGINSVEEMEDIEPRDIENRDVTPGRVSRSALNDRLKTPAGEESQVTEPTADEMTEDQLVTEAMFRIAESSARQLPKICDEYRERLSEASMARLAEACEQRKTMLTEDAKAKSQ